MIVEREAKRPWRASITTLFWACVISALLPIAAGFFWGGWTTAWSANRMASLAENKARTELMAELCVSRFSAATDAAAHLAELRDTDPWARSELLIKDGWTGIPGMSGRDQQLPLESRVGELCAKRLMTATPAQHAEASR